MQVENENEQQVLLKCQAYAHIEESYDGNKGNLKSLLEQPATKLGRKEVLKHCARYLN